MATATSFEAKNPNDTTDPADPARYGLLDPPVRITGSLTIPSADGTLLGEPVTAMEEGVARREYLSGTYTSGLVAGGLTLKDDMKNPLRLFQIRGDRLRNVVAGGMADMSADPEHPRLADPAKAFSNGDLNIPTSEGGLTITGSTRAFRGPDYLRDHPEPDPRYDNDGISYADCGRFGEWGPTDAERERIDELAGDGGPFASGSSFDPAKVDELAGLVSKYSVPVSPREGVAQVFSGSSSAELGEALGVMSYRNGDLTDDEDYLNEGRPTYPDIGGDWIRERWGRGFPGHENFRATLTEAESKAQFTVSSDSAATEHAFDVFSDKGELAVKNFLLPVDFLHVRDRVKWFGVDNVPTFSLAQPCWAVARLAWSLERRRYDQIRYVEWQNGIPGIKTLFDVDTPVEVDIRGTLFSQSWNQTIGEGTLSGTGGYQHIDGGNWYWSTPASGASAIKRYSYGGPETDGYIKTRNWLIGVQTGDPDNRSEFRLYRKIQTGEGPDDVEWSEDLAYDTASGCAWVKLPGITGATESKTFIGPGGNYGVLAPISAAALKLCQDKLPSSTPVNGHDHLRVWLDGIVLVYDKVRPFYE